VFEWKSAKVMAGEDVTRSMADWVNPVGRRRTYEMAKDSAVRGCGQILCSRLHR